MIYIARTTVSDRLSLFVYLFVFVSVYVAVLIFIDTELYCSTH